MIPVRGAPDPGGGRVGTEQLLRRLELTVTRRLDGILQGDYQGLLPSPGTEAGETRAYQPGDDVRLMDWNVTARTGEAHVRTPIADRELETWVLADLSASLDFGTASCEKRDLAVAAVAAVGHLTARVGNRFGAVMVHRQGLVTIPARPGRDHLLALLHRVAALPRADGGGATDLAAALEACRRVARRRGLVVVVSDFVGVLEGAPSGAPVARTARRRSRQEREAQGFLSAVKPPSSEDVDSSRTPPSWERPLRALAGRHDVVAVEVLDPRELELPDVGVVTLVDPETGGHLQVQTGDRRLRERYVEAAAHQRRETAASLRAAGADHLVLRTDRDWLADLVAFVGRRRQRRRGAPAGAGVGAGIGAGVGEGRARP